MDLYAQFKTSLKDPLSFKSAYIFFAFLFLVVLCSLILLLFFGQVNLGFKHNTACDKPIIKTLEGSVSNSAEKVYQVTYSGNKSCFLNSFVTWTKPNKAMSLWVYNPSGTVQIANPSSLATHTYYYQSSPLQVGTWRIVLRTDSSTPLEYSGKLEIN